MSMAIPLMSESRYQRELARRNSDLDELWLLLDRVKDPEIPAISLWDMGVLQDIERVGDRVVVTITPTYSGCPAMDQMQDDIKHLLRHEGIRQVSVKVRLAPAWTTEWITETGQHQLRRFGIAPPDDAPQDALDESGNPVTPDASVKCPHCDSDNTTQISEFGSTACKALFQCRDCSEPFDYFKRL